MRGLGKKEKKMKGVRKGGVFTGEELEDAIWIAYLGTIHCDQMILDISMVGSTLLQCILLFPVFTFDEIVPSYQ